MRPSCPNSCCIASVQDRTIQCCNNNDERNDGDKRDYENENDADDDADDDDDENEDE